MLTYERIYRNHERIYRNNKWDQISSVVCMGKVVELKRVPTGIQELDDLIEGGFLRNSLILIAGHPGSGKSTLAGQYIYAGATDYGENGVYACFSETKRPLIRNWRRFGWDFERLELEGKVSVLDLSVVGEAGIQENINKILEEINSIRAKRLVIDSFTAISLAMKDPSEVRFFLRLLYKFVQEINCTTMVIADIRWGTKTIGSGMEEFIADGIFLLETGFGNNEGLKRRLKILKMRGSMHTREVHPYEITDRGIAILPSLRRVPMQKVITKKVGVGLPKLKCLNCGHKWIPRIPDPEKCPICRHWLEDGSAKRKPPQKRLIDRRGSGKESGKRPSMRSRKKSL